MVFSMRRPARETKSLSMSRIFARYGIKKHAEEFY